MFALCLDWNYVGSGGSSIGGMRLIDSNPEFSLPIIQLFLRPCLRCSGKYSKFISEKRKHRTVRRIFPAFPENTSEYGAFKLLLFTLRGKNAY